MSRKIFRIKERDKNYGFGSIGFLSLVESISSRAKLCTQVLTWDLIGMELSFWNEWEENIKRVCFEIQDEDQFLTSA